MKNMPDSLHAIDWLIINRDETETYLNMTIQNTDDLRIAAQKWNKLGVSNVVITNGVKELIFRNSNEEVIKPVIPSQHVVDVTGAGDAFSSAVIFSWLNELDTESILTTGMMNARKTIETEYTVRQNLDKKQLFRDLEDYKNEAIY